MAGLYVWHKGRQFFLSFLIMFYVYLNASKYDNILFSFTFFQS